MVNEFNLEFVIKQIFNMQFYEGQKIDKIKWIYGKDNPTNAMTKTSSNLVLEGIISTNKETIMLKS